MDNLRMLEKDDLMIGFDCLSYDPACTNEQFHVMFSFQEKMNISSGVLRHVIIVDMDLDLVKHLMNQEQKENLMSSSRPGTTPDGPV
jgi:hypothetical protein